MTQPTAQFRPKRRLWIRLLTFAGAIALLSFVAMLIGIGYWSVKTAWDMEAELARIKELGEPISPEELDRYYRLPAEVIDTTELWLDAVAPLGKADFESRAAELPVVGNGGGEEAIPLPGVDWQQLALAQTLLEQYEASVQRLHQAAEQGGAARYPTDFANVLGDWLNDRQNLRIAGRLLWLESHVGAHEQDGHAAANSIATLLRLSESLQREPVLVSQLVRLALAGMAYETAARLVPCSDIPEADLRSLQAELRKPDYHQAVRNMLLGERVNGTIMFRDPGAFADGSSDDAIPDVTKPIGRTEDYHCYLEAMRELLVAAEMPWPEALQRAQSVDQRIFARATASLLSKMRYTLTALLIPGTSAAFQAAARTDAKRHACDVGIALTLYRQEHGDNPSDLASLVPIYLEELPIDPFNGKPLLYRVKDDVVTVYSVGPNRTDDGGTEGENAVNPLDIVTAFDFSHQLP